MLIVGDLRGAWDRCVTATRRAVGFGLESHNSRVPELDAWLRCTDADVGRIAHMPEKAQREISASVVSMEVYDFKCDLAASEDWDSARRKVNYEACCGMQAGRWTQVVPWDRHGHLNMSNTAYTVACHLAVISDLVSETSYFTGELVVSCILLLGAVAVYRVQSCCAYSDETTSSDDEPAGMYT